MIRLPRPRPVDPAPPPAPPSPPATEDAWRTLLLVVDFVKHAETKAAATLAFAGVLGGLLYTLLSKAAAPGVLLIVAASACALAVVVTAVSAGLALRPRVRLTGGPPTPNLIFYQSIAHRFPTDADAYVQAFTTLTTDRADLLRTVGEQAWAVSIVASRKYRAMDVAVAAALTAAATLTLTAALALLA